jgi:hypothetical protein
MDLGFMETADSRTHKLVIAHREKSSHSDINIRISQRNGETAELTTHLHREHYMNLLPHIDITAWTINRLVNNQLSGASGSHIDFLFRPSNCLYRFKPYLLGLAAGFELRIEFIVDISDD